MAEFSRGIRGLGSSATFVLSILLAGAPFTAPAATPAKSDNKTAAGDDLFRDGFIPKIYIQVPREGMATLRKYSWQWGGNDEDRIPVRATVKEGTSTYTNVAIRLKGAAGSFRPVDDNPGLSLNFDKWADGQRFHGLQKISLANSLQDQTFVSDKFSRELYLKAGVPVPRAGHARVYLNGRDLGLHVVTEGWNKQFLHHFFKNAKGNLYDCGFVKEITGPMHVNSGENPGDRSDLDKLAAAAKDALKKKRIEPLVPVLDIDRFISMIVLDALLWNWDGYSINHNNYRVFSDLDSGKMVFMPHGLDQMFWRPEGPIMPGGSGLVAQAILASREGRQLYMNRVRQVMGDFINSSALTERAREISTSIQPALKEVGIGALRSQQNAVDQFCRMIILRMASLNMQLAGSSNLVTLGISNSVAITNWTAQSNDSSAAPDPFHLTAARGAASEASRSVAWLEAGYYRLEGRVKSKGVRAADPGSGAGFRAISQRKPTAGVAWDWFPFRESRDYDKRGEMRSANGHNDRVTGDSDWKQISYDFELRQPMGDVQLFCELRSDKGEAWFDPESIRLIRQAAPAKTPKPQTAKP